MRRPSRFWALLCHITICAWTPPRSRQLRTGPDQLRCAWSSASWASLISFDDSNCSVSEDGCVDFSSALKSNPSSHLKELDLSANKLEDEGIPTADLKNLSQYFQCFE
uniref:Uncharacterized protein n=1 Tax=Astyanax mexicanus TaxID=7994 RepID=A0A3B1IRQ2_ASTMX